MSRVGGGLVSERFEIVREIGQGGMGIVYEAIDRKRGERVALKTMRNLGSASLYQFKREFRALADVVHPNLVRLYELVSADDQTYFTMELVEGASFLEHVWAEFVDLERAPTLTAEASTGGSPERDAAPRVDFERVRSAFGQLATGLVALHAAGRLHRDIKPSNVLVDRAGRVVIVDFGLAADLEDRSLTADKIVGTPAYMAPEQADGGALTVAADWYAAGALLFEAITGELPFQGAALETMLAKRERDAPSASSIAADVPADLEALCAALLRRAPHERPRGAEVVERLSGRGVAARPRTDASSGVRLAPTFVGREAELATLQAAFDAARVGKTRVVFVHGPSGIGKSALVREIAGRAEEQHGATVLSGRCHETESIPYKALDGVLDALTSYLRRRSEDDVRALLPVHVQALARLFPVLLRVEPVVRSKHTTGDDVAAHEVRRRASVALGDLLTRLASRRPLLLVIDDMQWGDLDSIAILAEALDPMRSPPMVLVITHREDPSTPVAALRALCARWAPALVVDDVSVGPLAPAESEELAARLLTKDGLSREQAHDIAREAQGHPMLVDELVRHVRSLPPASTASRQSVPPRLDDAIRDRVARLEGRAQALLDVVALAGKPIEIRIAGAAAGLSGTDASDAVAALRAAHFVRTQPMGDSTVIEPFHDRVREAIATSIGPSRAMEIHRRIADSLLVSVARSDLEALVGHLVAAGDLETASSYAAEAGDRAARALAFEHAASLYKQAMDLGRAPPGEVRPLRRKLADALAAAGRSREAADEYFAAAEGAGESERFELNHRAAGLLLRAGYMDEGLEAFRDVLRSVGVGFPRTPIHAALGLLACAIIVRLFAWMSRPRDAANIAPARLVRVDAMWSATTGLAIIDNIRARYFGARCLVEALRLGEPDRIARSRCVDVWLSGIRGSHNMAYATWAERHVAELVRRSSSQYVKSFFQLSLGVQAFLQGRYEVAERAAAAAEDHYRDHPSDVTWDLDNARIFTLWSRWQLGRVREVSERAHELRRGALARGDRYLLTMLSTGRTNVRWLVADRPEDARREVDEVMRDWTNRSTHMQHFHALYARCHVALYEGRGAAALAEIGETVPRLRRALLTTIQSLNVELFYARGRCALQAARSVGDASIAQVAAEDSRALVRSGAPWGRGYACVLEAGVARDAGARRAALERAVKELEAHGFAMHAATVRHRLGDAEGTRWLEGQGVVNPDRFVEMLVPRGPWEVGEGQSA